MTPFAWLCLTFLVLLLLRTPVAFAIAIASFVGYAFIPDPFGSRSAYALMADMTGGMNQNALLCIPFFILAGKIMGSGGIADRLIGFARSLVGWVRGGTSYVSVLSSMFFGGVSGSAVADASSIGSIMIPMMKKEGYDPHFATAVTISSSTLGLIIPPSNVMILYVVIAAGTAAPAGPYARLNADVASMFLAGFVPGIVVGLSLMGVCGVLAHRRGYPKGQWLGPGEIVRRLWRALPALGIVVVILAGILTGFMRADESAAVAAVCGVAVSVLVYREMSLRQVPALLVETLVTTGVVFFLIAASCAMKQVFLAEKIDAALFDLCLRLTSERLVFLLVLNVLLLVAGLFLDMTPAVLIFTPLFLPVAVKYGVHPIHFGLILTVNLCIGLCTPPVGNCLFVGCSLSGVSLSSMVRPLLPFYAAMVAALLLVTYVESIPMWLPAHWVQWFPSVVGPGP